MRSTAPSRPATCAAGGGRLPEIRLERPARPEHGDFATNAAMQLAPVVRAAPMQIAEVLRTHLGTPPGIARGQRRAARLPQPAPRSGLGGRPAWPPSVEGGPSSGGVQAAEPHRINVEFVSANPTGPLTVGNARGAFVGDLLSRVLEAVGHEVTREYYFNDFNAQVRNLGLSVLARHEGREVPEDGYHGDYVTELAAQVPDELWQQAAAPDADPGEVLGRWASERVRAGIEASLAALGVRFDVWKSEGSLHARGLGRAARWTSCAPRATSTRPMARPGSAPPPTATTRIGSSSAATASPPTSPRTSATWPRSSAAASTSSSTCGARTTTARWRATRRPPRRWASGREHVQYLLMAWVRFVRDGEEIGMSKRAGEFVSLDELLAEIGADAARWFFGSRAPTTGIDFDIELAKKQSAENPVYYVQYAHARCSSILRNAVGAGRDGRCLAEPQPSSTIRPSRRSFATCWTCPTWWPMPPSGARRMS